MLDIEVRKMLFELLCDGAISFDTCPKKLDSRMKDLLKMKEEDIEASYQKSFDKGYLKTYDNKLTPENLSGKDSKLFILNVEKMFEDKILKDIKGFEELKDWYERNKYNIKQMNNLSLFLAHLDSTGHKDEANIIIDESNKIGELMGAEGNPEVRLTIVLSYLNRIELRIIDLPEEYHYALELFAVKNYYKLAKGAGSNIFNEVSRNDKCPCGSGKKAKNCCLNLIN